MKKRSILGFIGAAATIASLVPFEWKKEENGDFSYKSLLLSVSRKDRDYNVHFFNLPEPLTNGEKMEEEKTDETVETSMDGNEDLSETLSDTLSDTEREIPEENFNREEPTE